MNKLSVIVEWTFTIAAGLGLGLVIATTPPPPPPLPLPPLPATLIAPEAQWDDPQHCGCGATSCSMPCSNCCAPNKCICHDNPAPTASNVADVRSFTVSVCRHH